MGTTADEVLLLQEVSERQLIDIALILHESEAERRDQELHVHAPADRSRYLDGILASGAFIIKWGEGEDFGQPLAVYADALL